MDLWDRFLWLAIGCLIGFVLGYIVRSLRDIEKKVDHVDKVVKEVAGVETSKWDRNDRGFMRHPVVADVIIFLVVAITAWAAFATAKVNGELQRTIHCMTQHNEHQSEALRTRDHSIHAGTQSEIHLWTRYGQLYAQAKSDPTKIPVLQERLNAAIQEHRNSLLDLQETREAFPYADPDVLANCEEVK